MTPDSFLSRAEAQARLNAATKMDPKLHTRQIMCCTGCQIRIEPGATFSISWNPAGLFAYVHCMECALHPNTQARGMIVREALDYATTSAGTVRSAADHLDAPRSEPTHEVALVAAG
jgi:hypothetical protein